MDVMNEMMEIDRLIASMDTDKVESAENVQPGVVLDNHQSSDYDPDFLNTILNEIDKGDVSTSENNESAENVQPGVVLDNHQSSDYDPDFLNTILNEIDEGDVSTSEKNENATAIAAFPLAEADQVLSQLKFQDITPFHHSSSADSNLFVNEATSLAVKQEAIGSSGVPVTTITYQLGDQQMVILPTKLSPNQNIPVVVSDALPFQFLPVNVNSEITSATVDYTNFSEEAPASPTTTTNTPNPSGSRKRKLYEEDEFSDPKMEKKRQNAINAYKHRIRTKEIIQDLQQRLDTKEQECVALTREVEEMNRKLGEDQIAHKMELTTLQKQNEELKHKLQILTFLTS